MFDWPAGLAKWWERVSVPSYWAHRVAGAYTVVSNVITSICKHGLKLADKALSKASAWTLKAQRLIGDGR